MTRTQQPTTNIVFAHIYKHKCNKISLIKFIRVRLTGGRVYYLCHGRE